jgi:general secretion pathway protein F
MQFEVKAWRTPEDIVALSVFATDEQDARSQMLAQGYQVLAIRGKQALMTWRPSFGNSFPLTLFSQELLALLAAGLTIVEAMDALEEKEARPEIKKMFQQTVTSLYQGHPLSFALHRFPKVFPALYVSTIRASEKTGDLAEALTRYVAYQSQMDAIRKKVVSSSVYPLLLVGAGGLVVLFLMGYVVPRFSRIYEDMGSNLPFLSKMLLRWGQLLQANTLMVLGCTVLAAIAAFYSLSQVETRQWLLRQLLKIPAAGERMRLYQLARFYRTLGMLLRGGTPIDAALRMVADLLQPALRDNLYKAAELIGEGHTISTSMESHGLITPVALRLLRVGERTGRMGEMMDRIAAFHDEEMARWVDWFTRLFEPLLMALIGVVIGVIVILMYFPIFELASNIQ